MDKSEPWDYIVNHVKSHNISYMTKSEWEQLFIYTWIKANYSSDLSSLSVENLYYIADTFNIDFNQLANIIRKCKRLQNNEKSQNKNREEYIEVFKDLVNKNAFSNFCLSDNLSVKFKILNPIVQSELEKIFNILGIFSDTSFSKDIVTITTDSFLELTGTKKTLSEKIKSVLSGIKANVKDYFEIKETNTDTIQEIHTEIEKAKSKQTIAELVSVLKTLTKFKVNLSKIVKEILTAVFANKEDFTNINFEEKRA